MTSTSRRPIHILLVVLMTAASTNNLGAVEAFSPTSCHTSLIRRTAAKNYRTVQPSTGIVPRIKSDTSTTTSLNVLLDVPPYFFTFTFPMLGIILSVSKGFGRLRTEERAWEQRLEEAREKRLREDPTLSEIELRRKEAALEWSAYGKPRQEENEALERELRGNRRRVKVMERDDYDDSTKDLKNRDYRMSDDEINLFELEYGVDYDPYYDDPYSTDELPEDMSYQVDKRYGDRIYSNGEIFYKDKASGLFYRQGAKPRNLSFW
jgi:hypothetical protein